MRLSEAFILISGVLSLISFVAVSGCFVTNCPPGGKRSGSDLSVRECQQCGPPGMKGHCFGSHICCSPEFGCLMGTVNTLPCLQENLHSTLCQNPGNSCTGNDNINGQCAANGLCCSTETCTFDDNCKKPIVDSIHDKQGEPSVFIPKVPFNEEHQMQSGYLNPFGHYGHHFMTLRKPLRLMSSDMRKLSESLDPTIPSFNYENMKTPTEEEY